MPNGEIADLSNSRFFVTSGVDKGGSLGFNSDEDNTKTLIDTKLSSLFDCSVVLNKARNSDYFRILCQKISEINEKLNHEDIKVSFDPFEIKRMAKKINGLKNLEDEFKEKISDVINKDILSGKKDVKLRLPLD